MPVAKDRLLKLANSQTSVAATPGRRPKSRDMRPLLRLVPYFRRYPGRVLLALGALIVAAGTTLAVPVAVRRLIDHGFSSADADTVNRYFLTMLAIVAVLAIASGTRFYFVTWLSERVVGGCSPPACSASARAVALFLRADAHGRGGVAADGGHDADQDDFRLRGFGGLRKCHDGRGRGDDGADQSASFGAYASRHSLDYRAAHGFRQTGEKLSRQAQDRLAGSAATAQETLSAISIVQAYGKEGACRAFVGKPKRHFGLHGGEARRGRC